MAPHTVVCRQPAPRMLMYVHVLRPLNNYYRWDYEEGVSKDRPGRCADDTSSLLRLFPHALAYSPTYNSMTRAPFPGALAARAA